MEFDKYIAERLREATQDGPDAVLDAVGIEAYGSPGAQLLQQATGLLPDKVAQLAMGKGLGGPHRGAACGGPPRRHDCAQRCLCGARHSHANAGVVRQADPASLRPLQCHRKAQLLPIAEDADDPGDRWGPHDQMTNTVPLSRGPELYETF